MNCTNTVGSTNYNYILSFEEKENFKDKKLNCFKKQ